MKATLVLILLVTISANIFSQDISGKWVSVSAFDSVIIADLVSMRNMTRQTIQAPDSTITANLTRNYTIIINKKMKSLTGISKFKSPEMDLDIRSDLVGTLDSFTHTMVISDEDMYITTSSRSEPSKRIYNYDYNYMDDRRTQGYFRPRSNTRNYKWSYSFDETNEYLQLDINAMFGSSLFAKRILFKRPKKVNKKEKKNPIPNETITATSDSTFIHPVTQRTNKIFQEIVTESDSVKVDLYDVGEIDGDSVSLFLNGKLIAEHQMLKANALSFILKLDRSIAENRLVLFAENLGSIPPNTSYMVITINKKEYKLNMQSDEKTNGEIVFRFPNK